MRTMGYSGDLPRHIMGIGTERIQSEEETRNKAYTTEELVDHVKAGVDIDSLLENVKDKKYVSELYRETSLAFAKSKDDQESDILDALLYKIKDRINALQNPESQTKPAEEVFDQNNGQVVELRVTPSKEFNPEQRVKKDALFELSRVTLPKFFTKEFVLQSIDDKSKGGNGYTARLESTLRVLKDLENKLSDESVVDMDLEEVKINLRDVVSNIKSEIQSDNRDFSQGKIQLNLESQRLIPEVLTMVDNLNDKLKPDTVIDKAA